MDCQLVSSLQPEGGDEKSPPRLTHAKIFEELFPYYLSIGMTYKEYWDDDPQLAKYYRKSFLLKQKRENERLWLQGLYVYEAICDASPIFNPFAPAGTKPAPYSEKPYAFGDKEEEEEKRNRAKMENMRRRFLNNAASVNKRFSDKPQKEGEQVVIDG